jgi:hypothetical protein
MKTRLSVTLIFISSFLIAQNDSVSNSNTGNNPLPSETKYSDIKRFETEYQTTVKKLSGDCLLLSTPAINLFFYHRLAYYFNSDNDVSLFNNYAFANIADGRLGLGKNLIIKDCESQRMLSMLSFGLSATADEDKKITTLYIDNRFSGKISFDLQFNYFFSGSVYYDQSTRIQRNSFTRRKGRDMTIMDVYRVNVLLPQLSDMIKKDTAQYNKLVDGIEGEQKEELLKKFNADKVKEYRNKLAEQEVEFLEQGLYYTASKIYWINSAVSIPITGSRFNVADNYSNYAVEREQWKAKLSVQFNYLYESFRSGRFYWYAGGAIFNNNSAEAGDLELLTIDKYKGNGGNNTSVINSGNSLYVGDFSMFNDGSLYVKFVYYLPKEKAQWIGMSFFAEQRFREQRQVMNIVAGIPMTFAGQGDKRINIELQFRWANVTNALTAAQNDKAKFSMGIKLGLPFGQSAL